VSLAHATGNQHSRPLAALPGFAERFVLRTVRTRAKEGVGSAFVASFGPPVDLDSSQSHTRDDGDVGEGFGLMSADNTAGEQRGRPFQKGQSGNPGGRPRGARDATTVALEALLDGEAEALTRKAVELALAGDIQALRIYLDRILPTRKDRPVTFALPPINAAQDAATTVSAVLAAVSSGEITPTEAAEISKLIEVYVRAFETAELAERLERLEQMTSR